MKNIKDMFKSRVVINPCENNKYGLEGRMRIDSVNCLVCNSLDVKQILRDVDPMRAFQVLDYPIKGSIFQCNTCGISFASSNIPIETAFNVYGEVYKEDVLLPDSLFFLYYTFTRKIKNLHRGARVLEIGAGDGRYMLFLKKSGIDVFGVEINKEAGTSAIARGIEKDHIFYGDFLEMIFPEKKFDFILMWQLFEHIPDPSRVLKKCRYLLKDDGKVVIGLLPNFASLEQKLLGKNNFFLGIPYHFIQYTPNSIERILSNSEFKVISRSFDFITPSYFVMSLIKIVEKKLNIKIRLSVVRLTSILFFPIAFPLNIFCALIKAGTTMNIVASKNKI